MNRLTFAAALGVLSPHRHRRALLLASAPALAIALLLDFLWAPEDSFQGPAQRIFYVHVGAAVAAYACFAAVLLGGVAYLWWESGTADRLARAAAKVGLVMTSVVLIMGSLWGRQVWGTYWTWDARLTATLVLWMVYAGYLLLRRITGPGPRGAKLSAVVGIVGFVDVPIVHFSVNWWRTLHPQSVVQTPAGPQLPVEMLVSMLVTMAAMLLLTAAMTAYGYRLEMLRDCRAVRERRPASVMPDLDRAGVVLP